MSSTGGRKQKKFQECTTRSKRQKTNEIRKSNDCESLSFATSMALRQGGNEAGAKLVHEIGESPDRARTILKTWKSAKKEKVQQAYTAEEAVNLIVSNNITKSTYLNMRKGALVRNHNLYPSYHVVLNEKKAAYPPDVQITETKCDISLQSLLDHTCRRLLEAVCPTYLINNEDTFLKLICKCGFDGSSGHSMFKQKWSEPNVGDENMFLTSIVPLRIVNEQTGEIVWDNIRSSSPRFCRPLSIEWVHENDQVIRTAKRDLDAQIAKLEPFSKNMCNVSYSIHLTMIDGKVSSI